MRSSIAQVLAFITLLGMSCGRSATSPETGDASGTASSEDEEKPDQSAPVSGAYLTCIAPEPTVDMDYMVAACQLRDGQHRHIAVKDPNTRWAYAPAEGKTGPTIEVYDLYDKPQHYFDAMFVMRFGAGLTQVNKVQAIDYFLSAVPVLAPNTILLSSVKKSQSNTTNSANLTDPVSFNLASEDDMPPAAKAADAMTFRLHNKAVDEQRTMPAEPVAGMRGRPYVLPQVIEVNGLPVLPQVSQQTATGPQSIVLTPEQQLQQQQATQNALNAQLFGVLIQGATKAIASMPTQPVSQTGVVSGPPPAQSGGCTCKN